MAVLSRGKTKLIDRERIRPTNKKVEVSLKTSVYKSYDDLPLFLNAETVGKVLGVSSSSAYELMHEPSFPTLRIGSRMVVPKEQFVQWVSAHTQGGGHQ